MNPATPRPSFTWLWQMAWRESRKNRSRLFLFMASILLGVAALVAIRSFSLNLNLTIELEAKTLLGADLVLDFRQPPSPKIQAWLDSLAKQPLIEKVAREINFGSMVYFTKNGGTRLAQVRALEGDFPFYGSIDTDPVQANKKLKQTQIALVDQTLLKQFESNTGDTLQVGNLKFVIEAKLLKVPGQNGITATVAPTVYIPLRFVEQTGLLQKGSRVGYVYYYKVKTEAEVGALAKSAREQLAKENVRVDTVAARKQTLQQIFENLASFFNLLAFVALLLGCVGVASAVSIYLKSKITTVALLRCIGATGQQAFWIFLIQIVLMGGLGSLAGAILGSGLQWFLPYVLGNFLPVSVATQWWWSSIAEGVAVGLCVSVLFALLPLLKVQHVSPLRTLRMGLEEDQMPKLQQWLIYGLIVLFIFGFTYWQIRDWRITIGFTGALLVSFLLLWGLAQGLMFGLKRFFPTSWNYLLRQSIANLFRPDNQTIVLIICIGLGTTLISLLMVMQSILLSQVSLADRDNQPNFVIFDIQPPQLEAVRQSVESAKVPVLQQVPIVTMRLASFKGKTREQYLEDSSANRLPRDVINREYRVTYRDTLNRRSEQLVKGRWVGSIQNTATDTIWVSMDELHASRMKAQIGDEVVFDVQGRMIKTYIGSLRKLTFNRIETSFTVVFPTGVLEKAPQFYTLISRVNDSQTSAKVQRQLINQYPNVSIIDLQTILKTIEDVLNQISFVIQFMSVFSMLTGLIVLVGSVLLSKFQRIQESVLLRTLGATRRQIFYINSLEYLILGSLASLSGIGLSVASGWLLCVYVFKLNFFIQFFPLLFLWLGISAVTVFIGWLNGRSVLNKTPLEVLRAEV